MLEQRVHDANNGQVLGHLDEILPGNANLCLAFRQRSKAGGLLLDNVAELRFE